MRCSSHGWWPLYHRGGVLGYVATSGEGVECGLTASIPYRPIKAVMGSRRWCRGAFGFSQDGQKLTTRQPRHDIQT